jgi:RHS repeat-associated protein
MPGGPVNLPTSGLADAAEAPSSPQVSLPKGGGSIRGMGEKFGTNPVTGTGSITVPIALSPGRSRFTPQLALSYDSGAGNGPFGLGWNLSLPAITRKTDKGLPRYADADESDVFILSGAEDLVPWLDKTGDSWHRRVEMRTLDGAQFSVQRYRPRIEGLFARIERWTCTTDAADVRWRSISRDNVTTWYGRTAESRIVDSADPTRIGSWAISESYDDRGNAALYRYKAEDSANIDTGELAHERNRTPAGRSTGRYLKRILYANRTPRTRDEDLAERDDWLLEAVFDYGEHYTDDAHGNVLSVHVDDQQRSWPVREDPFSSYRAGFEVRTYRLCQRVLMFHHFPEELGTPDCLVRSTDVTYTPGPVASFIAAITQSGYVRRDDGTYLKRSLPPLEFEYSQAVVDDTVRDVDQESLANLPAGAGAARYQWLDLDGEGVPSVLVEEDDAWYYKRNVSPVSETVAADGEPLAVFEPVTEVASLPSFADASAAHHQFVDLAGDGQLDCVVLEGPTPGFFERTETQDWDAFKPLALLPNADWREPNLRFVDLTGDGRADILVTEDDVLTWYPSIAETGFAGAIRVPKPRDEEAGPAVAFADSTQAIFIADMSGDGLHDIVRIRNGDICYWPNLGYGRFGSKVSMDNAPWFDAPDAFDQRRIRLADIDGSGVTDIIYLAAAGVRLYFNQSGNRWSDAQALAFFPAVDNLAAIQAVDLLGNGTACLVWTSPLPAHARTPMRYVDLMGGQKPHLLVRAANNLGAETRIDYAASTKFSLADRRDGRPWITRLPFPVHVVERVHTLDRISGNRFVTRFAYHHGYFDGVEREFRGFGMVEQWDTEEFAALTADGTLPPATNVDAASHVPPVLTRTWFHTGVFVDRVSVSNYFAGLRDGSGTGEYFREPGLDAAAAAQLLLDDTVLPPGLSAIEEREACRALKGAMLRQEVYALDGSPSENYPYLVTEQNFTIRLLQPRGDNRHCAFFTHSRESIGYHYERNPADPRVVHSLTLDVDDFGNVLASASAVYPRRHADPTLDPRDQQKQAELRVTSAQTMFTNAVDTSDAYRAPLACETRSFEVLNIDPGSGSTRLLFDDVATAIATAGEIAFEQDAAPGMLQKRLIGHTRTLFRADDLSAALPLGQVELLALPFQTFTLVFTPGLLSSVYDTRVTNSMLATDGGYVHSEGDDQWWKPSARVFFSSSESDDAATELATASQHFFLPRRHLTPFGHSTTVAYDRFDLLVQETRDPLANTATVGERDAAGTLLSSGNDYRVLQPRLVTDANGNRSAVVFDALGMVVGTAVMGKRDEVPRRGDALDGFDADLADDVIAAHLAEPLIDPHAILGRATTRLVYDLSAYRRTQDQAQPSPAVVYVVARETHDADLAPGELTAVQHSFSYSDGFGREIQSKLQAEPGPLAGGGEDLPVRWIGSGWKIFNNKGAAVRTFEPFFSATQAFEFDVRAGRSPIVFYDPVGRAIGTAYPNHTWEKVRFGAWSQESWDVNDTVLIDDPRADADVGRFFARLADGEYTPTWYAQRQGGALGADDQDAAAKAAVHADTPLRSETDSLGRIILTIAHDRFIRNSATVEEFYPTRIDIDIQGNQRQLSDAVDRIVVRGDYDLIGTRIRQARMDAGERWTLNDAAGQLIYAWDSRGHEFHRTYDALRRPVDTILRDGTAPPQIVGRSEYGEGQSNPESRNLRGKVVRLFDQAGLVTTDSYDFKGNLLSSRRQLAQEYKAVVDWGSNPPLEIESFASATAFDALNRPVAATAPDGSVYRATFNEANLLERAEVKLAGASVPVPFVASIDYDAQGQRTLIRYGNGVETRYDYDPLTQRLRGLRTTRASDHAALQDLAYTFDPAGNVTRIVDAAQQTVYFSNQVVTADNDYVYDAMYRLIGASGREHIGQLSHPQADWSDEFRVALPSPTDGQAMRRYSDEYQYDAAGNVLALIHRAVNGNWTRTYAYAEESGVEHGTIGNRVTSTTVGADPAELYTYDPHGNMTSMPHLSSMRWDFRDLLAATSRQIVMDGAAQTTYYVYDAGGRRVRKVTERQSGPRVKERCYLGGFEVYREYDASGMAVTLERQTLHVMDDQQRVALVETRTQGTDGDAAPQAIRYQLTNHLGSAALEVDEAAQIISYEEYYPYGSTSYQAGRDQKEVRLKRYRYIGVERDDETGLGYHGARYYAPWLARWTSTDPADVRSGISAYAYCTDSPIVARDLNGRSPEGPPEGFFGKAWGWLKARGQTIITAGRILVQDPSTHLPSAPEDDAVAEGVKRTEAQLEIERGTGTRAQGSSPPPNDPPVTPDPPLADRNAGAAAAAADEPDKRLVTARDLHANRNLGNASAVESAGHGGGGGGGNAAARLEDLSKVETELGQVSKLESGVLKFGSFIEGFLPGPQDALLMELQVFATYGETQDDIKREWLVNGFAAGLAARLLGMSSTWVNENLRFTSTSSGVEEHFIGAEGMRESSFNRGLREGYRYGRNLTSKQTKRLLKDAFTALAAKGYSAGLQDDDLFTADNVRRVGGALVPSVEKVFAAAAERRARKQMEQLQHDPIGSMFRMAFGSQ